MFCRSEFYFFILITIDNIGIILMCLVYNFYISFQLSHSLENLILTHAFSHKISTLPRGLLKPLQKLNILKINHNSLTKLPQELNTLNNLQILHAHDNKIDALYSGIFKVTLSLYSLKNICIWHQFVSIF